MAIYRKEGSPYYWYSFTYPNGQRVRKSTRTTNKIEAQRLYDKLKADSWNQANLNEKPRRTWKEAVVKFITEARFEKKRIDAEIDAFKSFDPYLHDKYIDEIDKSVISFLTDKLKAPYTITHQSGKVRDAIASPGTINRKLSTLRSLLNKCVIKWEWIDKAPKISFLKPPPGRIIWITREQANRLISFLPSHLAAMAEYTLQTGVRRHNATHLEWKNVDLVRKTAWVEAEDIKNEKALFIPLNDIACSILEKQRGKHPQWVFPFRGNPVEETCTRAYRKAIKKAGIDPEFCWHSLRHTWASWHVQNGTPIQILMELGGWSSLSMVMRYAHLNSDHLRAWADRPTLHLIADNQKKSA